MTILEQLIDIFRARPEFFLRLTIDHIWISALAIAFAVALGLALGIVANESKRFEPLIMGVVNTVYTIPSISLLGFLIPFSGVGNTTAIIALTIYALMPMVRGTHSGLEAIDKSVLEAAEGMGSTRRQILLKIKLPLALPLILSGLRNTVVMTIALAGIASFIGAGGLGVAIYRGITTNNAAMTLAGSLLIALLAFITDGIIARVETAIRRKRRMLPANTAKSIMKTKGFLALAAAAILIPLLLFGCSGNDGNTVRIATKPQTEQFLLGEMLKLVIEQDTGLAVAITHGVGGGTANIHPALLKGEFDLYPEYTGTAWLYVLKNKPDPDEQNMRRALFAEYPEKFGLEWVGLYGFNNSFGLAVRKDIADKHGLKSYSDLVPISGDLTFGAEYDFYEREDGYDALVRTYGFKFPKHIDLDIGLKYPAIGKGEIDVMNVFTTDGQLNAGTVTVLRDDKNFYQTYYCGTVARRETLDKHPNLEPALRKMEGVLDDEEMSRLNYEVDVKGRQPTDVAREFLVGKGLLRAGQ